MSPDKKNETDDKGVITESPVEDHVDPGDSHDKGEQGLSVGDHR